MALDGVVFDLDGTLLDTNDLHVEAWRRAFEAFGFSVAPDRIAPEIARDADELVASILGRETAKEHGEKLSEAVKSHVEAVIDERTPLPVFAGARELLKELRARGLKTALATTAGKGTLQKLCEGSGFELDDFFDAIVTADDTQSGKPAPDPLEAACNKLELSPAQCVLVGDALWDAHSARRAGVCGIGILAGSAYDETALREAGMRLVYPDVASLLTDLDNALQVASPGALQLTKKIQEDLMSEALQVARNSMEDGGVPIGAVLAQPRGANFEVIARGFNELHRTQNPTDHAEIVTFRNTTGKLSPEARDAILVSTLEPCVMCLGAAMEAAVDVVLYALQAPADSGTTRVAAPQSPESQMPRIIGGLLASHSRALFEEWLQRNANDPEKEQQAQFVRQLLELTE